MKYNPHLCIECKENTVSHHRAYFCRDCQEDFFNTDGEDKQMSGHRKIQND